METKIITINRQILWIKLLGIAAIQGAITLTWVIYNLYLPILLVQLGFSQELAVTLLIVENALATFIEPIFGAFSDRQQRLFGSKLSIILSGIIVSSALFIVIPSFVIFSNDNQSWYWLFLVLVVFWALAMAIFRSPAMSLLGRCATTDRLPQAASILTLVGGVVGALRFDAYGLIINMGAGFAFTIGSLSLLGAAAILRFVHLPEPEISFQEQTEETTINPELTIRCLPKLGLIFLTGIAVSWGLRFLIPTVSSVLTIQVGKDHSKLAMTLFFLILGLVALPSGKIASKLENSWGIKLGLMLTVLTLLTLIFMPNGQMQFIAIAILAIGFSLVLNGAVPFALNVFSPSQSGLSVGMYFGGFGGGMSLFNFFGSKLGATNFEAAAIGGSIAFILALLCISFATNLKIKMSDSSV